MFHGFSQYCSEVNSCPTYDEAQDAICKKKDKESRYIAGTGPKSPACECTHDPDESIARIGC